MNVIFRKHSVQLCFQAIFIVSIAQHTPITLDNYKYPLWGDAIGLFLSISSMICIPLYFIYRFIISKGDTIAKVLLPPLRR